MRRSLLPLNALRVFDAAARSLSFTRAADELAVTPAAVGQQIRALEETLGVILFRRTARGLELTPEADSALPALRAGFQSLEETVEALQAGQTSLRMTIAVARPALRHWLAPRLDRWLDTHPLASVRLLPLDQPVDFREANLDLALTWGPAPDAEGVTGRTIADEQWTTVTAGDAGRMICWAGDGQTATDNAIIVADAGAALDLVLAGLGTARIPLTLALSFIESGRIAETAPRMPCEQGFWLCAPAPQWKSQKVKDLVATLLGQG
ncbi:MAG: LysR family transcriptional regulator [Sphingomonadaceae bacterium]